MSRHRNVRQMIRDEDYGLDDDEDDFYDDDYDDFVPPPRKPAAPLQTAGRVKTPNNNNKSKSPPEQVVQEEAAEGPAFKPKFQLKSLQSLKSSQGPKASNGLKLSSLAAGLSKTSNRPSKPSSFNAVDSVSSSLITSRGQEPVLFSPSRSTSKYQPSAFAKVLVASSVPSSSPPPLRPGDNVFFVDTSKFQFKTPSPGDIVSSKREKSSIKSMPAASSSTSSQKALTTAMEEKKVIKKLSDLEITKNSSTLKKSELPLINLVIVGHVDSGKSTLMGHLLQLLGEVSTKQAQKLAHDSQKQGKTSFKYAWAMDSSQEERERGVTIDVAFDTFQTSTRRFCILDSPGHRDFVSNMISGANKADYAVLVIDSAPGGFESGFHRDGQTREHALLCRSMGIPRLIVVLNKMDSMQWSRERYEEITSQMESFLVGLGFACEFVPVSAFKGQNIVEPYWGDGWYTGPSLVQILDRLVPPSRPTDKPLRFMINDINGSVVSGSVITGSVSTGESLLLMPGRYECSCKSVANLSDGSGQAQAGDSAVLNISLDPEMISVGSVLCSSKSTPICVSKKIKAKIMTFECRPLISGLSLILHYHNINIPCSVNLLESIDKASGLRLKVNPRSLGSNACAIVELDLDTRICIEPFSVWKEFGRFTLRLQGGTVAAGIVLDLIDK